MSIKRNTLWNLIGAGFPLIVGAATVPYLIKTVGVERFGVLTLLWAIIGYFGLFDFGLGRAITQRVAQSLADGSAENVPRLAGTGITLTAYAGAIGGVLLVIAAWPLAYSTLNVSPALHKETFLALIFSSLAIPFTTGATGFRGVLEAFEDFKSSNIAKIFLGTTIFLFPAIGVWLFGPSLANIALWLLLSRVATLAIFCFFYLRLPFKRVAWFKRDRQAMSTLIRFSVWLAISNFISPLLVYTDRFFISHMLGAAVVAYYTVPFEFIVRLLIIPGAIGATLLPRISISHCEAPNTSSALIKKFFILMAIIMGCCTVLTSLFSYPVMKYFIGADFANKSWLIAVLLSVGVFFNSLAFIPYTGLHARGVAKPTAILHLVEFLAYIPILIFAVNTAGLLGAAAAWVGRTFFDFLVLLYLHRKLELQIHAGPSIA